MTYTMDRPIMPFLVVYSTFRGRPECWLLGASDQGRSTLTPFVWSDLGYYNP